MKYLTTLFMLLIGSFLHSSCSDTELKEMNELISHVGRSLTEQEKEVLDSLKPNLVYAAQIDLKTRAVETSLYASEEEFDNIDFSVLPYYELNEDEFILDPSSDNIMNCIHPVTEKILYLGKKQGDIVMVLEAVKDHKGWDKKLLLEGKEFFMKNFSWLLQRLISADNKDYYMLNAIGLVYVVYEKNGEPVFCNFIGTNSYTKQQFAAIMLNRKNLKENSAAYFKKWNEEKKVP